MVLLRSEGALRPPLRSRASHRHDAKRSVVSAVLPPRILSSRGRAGHGRILTRLFDIQQELERVDADLQAKQREYVELGDKRHCLVSEHDRLRSKLMFLDEEPRP